MHVHKAHVYDIYGHEIHAGEVHAHGVYVHCFGSNRSRPGMVLSGRL
jgi:hypothetical protein